jgi:hypothetical protein
MKRSARIAILAVVVTVGISYFFYSKGLPLSTSEISVVAFLGVLLSLGLDQVFQRFQARVKDGKGKDKE